MPVFTLKNKPKQNWNQFSQIIRKEKTEKGKITFKNTLHESEIILITEIALLGKIILFYT